MEGIPVKEEPQILSEHHKILSNAFDVLENIIQKAKSPIENGTCIFSVFYRQRI